MISFVPASGGDFIWDRQGDDVFRGQGGQDRIQGYGGRDHIYGGAGNDPCLNTFDGKRGDVIRGNGGFDRYFNDARDFAAGVERRLAFSCELNS